MMMMTTTTTNRSRVCRSCWYRASASGVCTWHMLL